MNSTLVSLVWRASCSGVQLKVPRMWTNFPKVCKRLEYRYRGLHGKDRRTLIAEVARSTTIVVDDADNVRLTGFGIASRRASATRPYRPRLLPATLAYMAPEQTGRMNRSIDARRDLYSSNAA